MAREGRMFREVDIDITSYQLGRLRYPPNEPEDPPRSTHYRNNLTGLSHRYNLYLVAYEEHIHVYRPAFPSQKLSECLLKWVPMATSGPINFNPWTATSRHRHGINQLAIGDFGNEEVLMTAHDDGDFIVSTVRSILETVDAKERGKDISQTDITEQYIKFVHHSNVGDSAWGMASHKAGKLLAVSSNSHKITVYAPALTTDLPYGLLGPDRSCNKEFVFSGHRNNVPSVAFCNNDADKCGRYLVSTDIEGAVMVWDIWKERCVKRIIMSRTGAMHDSRYIGWSVNCVDPQAFKQISSEFELIGFPREHDLSRGGMDLSSARLYIRDHSVNHPQYARTPPPPPSPPRRPIGTEGSFDWGLRGDEDPRLLPLLTGERDDFPTDEEDEDGEDEDDEDHHDVIWRTDQEIIAAQAAEAAEAGADEEHEEDEDDEDDEEDDGEEEQQEEAELRVHSVSDDMIVDDVETLAPEQGTLDTQQPLTGTFERAVNEIVNEVSEGLFTSLDAGRLLFPDNINDGLDDVEMASQDADPEDFPDLEDIPLYNDEDNPYDMVDFGPPVRGSVSGSQGQPHTARSPPNPLTPSILSAIFAGEDPSRLQGSNSDIPRTALIPTTNSNSDVPRTALTPTTNPNRYIPPHVRNLPPGSVLQNSLDFAPGLGHAIANDPVVWRSTDEADEPTRLSTGLSDTDTLPSEALEEETQDTETEHPHRYHPFRRVPPLQNRPAATTAQTPQRHHRRQSRPAILREFSVNSPGTTQSPMVMPPLPVDDDPIPFSIIHTGEKIVTLLHPPFDNAGAVCVDPFHQHLPRNMRFLQGHDRMNMTSVIPELSVILIGSPVGRVGIFSLTKLSGAPHARTGYDSRNTMNSLKIQDEIGKKMERPTHAVRLDWILPLLSQEKKDQRPEVPLLGFATAPVQGHEQDQAGLGEDYVDGFTGARLANRRWRLLMTYQDHTVLSYELWRGGKGLMSVDEVVF